MKLMFSSRSQFSSPVFLLMMYELALSNISACPACQIHLTDPSGSQPVQPGMSLRAAKLLLLPLGVPVPPDSGSAPQLHLHSKLPTLTFSDGRMGYSVTIV